MMRATSLLMPDLPVAFQRKLPGMQVKEAYG
jgi:hypothetical protein